MPSQLLPTVKVYNSRHARLSNATVNNETPCR